MNNKEEIAELVSKFIDYLNEDTDLFDLFFVQEFMDLNNPDSLKIRKEDYNDYIEGFIFNLEHPKA